MKTTEPPFYRIGEVARRCGVSPDTLRHYERRGVLPKAVRGENNYRAYPESAVARVLLVRRAIALGFTLDEVAAILAERDRGGAPCHAVRALAERKLAALEERLRELTELRDEMRRVVAAWDRTLEGTGPGRQARLLEGLGEEKDA